MFGELRSLYQGYTADDDTVGVIQVDKTSRQSPNTDGFDTILLVVKNADEKIWSVKHYQIGTESVALHLVSSQRLEDWIKFSTYRRMIQWISTGKVLFDRNEFLGELKQEISRFPEELREVKLTQEYAKAIRMFKEAIQLYDKDEELDCFMFACCFYFIKFCILFNVLTNCCTNTFVIECCIVRNCICIH